MRAEAAAPASGVADRVLEAIVVDIRVGRRGEDVDVAGELVDDVDRRSRVGQVRRERVAKGRAENGGLRAAGRPPRIA